MQLLERAALLGSFTSPGALDILKDIRLFLNNLEQYIVGIPDDYVAEMIAMKANVAMDGAAGVPLIAEFRASSLALASFFQIRI